MIITDKWIYISMDYLSAVWSSKSEKSIIEVCLFCNLETRTNIDFKNDTTFVARILMYVQNELYAGKKNEKLLGLLG